jgi:4-hydroxy-tetrahydrodipicolinate reductase
MTRVIRVIQYGIGPIGAAIVRLMMEKPGIEIVGAIDTDPAKAGKDLGEVTGADRKLGVTVSPDANAVLRAGGDVVMHTTSSYLVDVKDQLIACAQARLNIVSTCEELSYPWRKHPELSRSIDQVARVNRVAILGTGVNPGFAMDKLPLTLATACKQVTGVDVRRIVDASRRRLPLQKKVGAGMTTEEFREKVAGGIIKHHGLPESVAMVADGLGLPVDRIEETIDPVIAQELVKTEYLEVPAGRVAGVHQVAHGFAADKEVIRMELQMYVGAKDPVDAVTIYGTPELVMKVAGGIHGDLATVSVAVNCIPAILDAQPGLRTSRDIPMCFFPGTARTATA